MWLDRFTAQSTPNANTPRSFSPAPSRRPCQGDRALPPRPGVNPRSSSLSLASSPLNSTTSIPSTARAQNASPLRRPNGTSAKVADPVQVLEQILGGPPRKSKQVEEETAAEPERPAQLAEDVDFRGLSLEAYVSAETARSRTPAHVHTYSARSVAEYDKEKDKFEDLHKSILACDEVLKNVETYLTNFQNDLAVVSAEIETLQSRSTALNTKLENRKVVEKLLGPAVEDIGISPAVVRKIAEGPIDEGYSKALAELEKRHKVIQAKSGEETDIKALADAKPLLDDLTNRAIERIRDYVVSQIKAMRSPSMNAQIIQQQALLKHKDLYAFLARHHPQLGSDICQAYVNTMRWYYQANFTRYRAALEKLKLHTIDKNETLGHEEAPKRGGMLSTTRPGGAPYDAFSLGRRMDILRNTSLGAVTAYVAEEDKSPHYLEVPFRALNIALIDNASFEYTFLTTFFSPAQSYHALSRTFSTIFDHTFTLAQTYTKTLIEGTTDAIGVLLCVRLNQRSAFELQRRKVPAGEAYINATNMLLWPRFQQIMDLHCTSIRTLTSSTLSSSSSQAAQSTAPHPLTQKFASFLHALLALSSEAGDDEPVHSSLNRLRGDFEAYLSKLSKEVKDARKRERFLGSNYSLVGTILADVEGQRGEEMRSHFEALKDGSGNRK